MLTLVSNCLHIVLLCKLLITNIASSGYEVIFSSLRLNPMKRRLAA